MPRPAVPLRDVVRAAPGRRRRAHRRHAPTSAALPAQRRQRRLDRGQRQRRLPARSATPPTRRRSPTSIGTFIHGPEVNLLTVQLDTPFQLGFDCGFDAQSCYFGGENKIVLSGDADPAPDSASRDFVLAHEYGHHVAQHRDLPAPFPAAINWGTERWASVEHVCQGHRAGTFFPGDEGTHYYEDPGEAFAESFAFNRFPDAAVEWAWAPALGPTAASLRALRRDTLRPWLGRHSFTVSGRVPAQRRHRPGVPHALRRPGQHRPGRRPPASATSWSSATSSGQALRSSRQGVSFRHRLDYTVCGQSRLRVAVRAARPPPASRFQLTIQRP